MLTKDALLQDLTWLLLLFWNREANRRAHSKPGSVPYVAERAKPVLGEKE